MGIDMSAYKMIYQDRVYNCLSMMVTWGENPQEVQDLEVFYIDNDNRVSFIRDKKIMFQFIIR